MSDIGIHYDASTSPSSIGVRAKLGFQGTRLRATLQEIDNFVIVLTPSGNISETVLSGIAWPLAQTIGAVLPTAARGLVVGQTFEVMTIEPVKEDLAGESLEITPDQLGIQDHGDMLMVKGRIRVA